MLAWLTIAGLRRQHRRTCGNARRSRIVCRRRASPQRSRGAAHALCLTVTETHPCTAGSLPCHRVVFLRAGAAARNDRRGRPTPLRPQSRRRRVRARKFDLNPLCVLWRLCLLRWLSGPRGPRTASPCPLRARALADSPACKRNVASSWPRVPRFEATRKRASAALLRSSATRQAWPASVLAPADHPLVVAIHGARSYRQNGRPARMPQWIAHV